MYCSSCGKEMHNTTDYCPHCGTSAHTNNSRQWDDFADSLANGCLELAKGLLAVLCSALAGVCGIAAAGALTLAGYLIYHFATGAAIIIPWFLTDTTITASVGGPSLLLGGLTALLIAVLLGIAAAALIRFLRAGWSAGAGNTRTFTSCWR